jgi:hypothetical protein
MFATTDEAFEDLRRTLAGIPDGEWVPPLAVWLNAVEGLALGTVRARLERRAPDLLRAWRAKRDAHVGALKAAVRAGNGAGKGDKAIAEELGLEAGRVRYVRRGLPEAIGGRKFIDWAAKTAVIPRGVRRMEIRHFVRDVGTPYQTAYSALRQGRVPGWGLRDGLAVRTEVER